MANKLQEFLRGCEISKDGHITHTSLHFDTNIGRYNIPHTRADTFQKIYAEHVFKNKKDCFLSEKHLERFSKICIDIDLKYDTHEFTTRQYTLDLIKDIVTAYQDALQEVTGQEMTDNELLAYVMEKGQPDIDEAKEIMKDGIHIMFPFVSMSYKALYWVRKSVIEKLRDHVEFSNCLNNIENIFDESVIERNNWMMYGSRKNLISHPYKMTHIFDKNLDEAELPEENYLLVKLLSIQNRSREKSTQIDMILEEEKKKIKTVVPQIPDMPRIGSKKSQEFLKTLLNLLNPIRVDDYHDWWKIGAILYSECDENLDLWKKWSSQSKKYEEKECDKWWNTIFPTHPDQKRLKIGTLMLYARTDSPTRYFQETEKYKEEDEFTIQINKALENTHTDFAELAHMLLGNKYRYSHRTWYQFCQNRWKALEEPIPMLKDLSINIRGVLFNYSSMLGEKITETEKRTGNILPDDDWLKTRRAKCEKSILLLKSYTYKSSVAKECCEVFYDEKFHKELDKNIYLIGFNNGVYNLKTGEFRETMPEDNISYTTGYDYTPSINQPIREEILSVIQTICPDDAVRDFVLTFLASTLIGTNKSELFVCFEGSGGNGKGVITGLHDMALGDYAGTLDNAYLTNVSNSQEGHDSKLISIFKKRYVQVNEPPKDKTLNQDKIKELTGNDKIQTRKAHSPDTEDTEVPMFKIVMLFNKMPKLNDAQCGGLKRRLKTVNFPNLFVDRNPTRENEKRADPNLKTRLKDNVEYRQQYMIILLEYVKKLMENDERILVPEAIELNTRQLIRQQDYYQEFVDSRLEITGNKDDVMSFDEIFIEYKDYYKENIGGGTRGTPFTKTEVIDRLKRCFMGTSVDASANIKDVGGRRKGRGFMGIKIQELD